MNHGFIKVASAIPEVKVADCEFNSFKIQKIIEQADSKGVEIICFPELSISAYTCADLFFQKTLLESAKKSLVNLVENTSTLNIICIVGLPLVLNDKLFNVAAVFAKGKILGFVPKTYLPNYYEFYEKRWFSSAKDAVNKELYLNTEDYSDGISKKPIESQFCEADRISKPESSIVNEDLTIDKSDEIDVERRKIEFVVSGQNPSSGNNYYPFTSKLIFGNDKVKFSIEICEDLWAPTPPSSGHCPAGAHLVFNLSASNELIGKHIYRKELIMQQSAKCMAGYIYSGSGWGESTTDIVFSGNAIIAENGAILNEAERFSFSEQLVIADIDVDRLKVNRAQ
ncbi:MAG: hypothetical protein LBR10_04235, partial [Prevotellaceae bacterium]|nr:hypothetical protein [Prevotellaceae bacterium]